MAIQIALANIQEWETEERFHALLCDPPYELGFMNRDWDSSGVAFDPETWAHLAQFLLPGAFGMAFAGSRGWHRMAVAIEDGGLIIHPTIFLWSFGSGFPKATRVDTKIDTELGLTRDVKGVIKATAATGGVYGTYAQEVEITEPASELAAEWVGHRYGLQALKPAVEPIVVFQKPYEASKIKTIMNYGSGALNVQAGRIGDERRKNEPGGFSHNTYTNSGPDGWSSYGADHIDPDDYIVEGRWPPNFGLTHSPECNEHRCDCGLVDFQREYYHQSYWNFEQYENVYKSPLSVYCAKASQAERNAGLLDRTPRQVNDGRKSSIDNPYQRGDTLRRNPHPTVKPIGLTKWLAKLLLPPASYDPKLLVPFSGVGSEVIGAYMAGWENIQGVELTEEFTEVSYSRVSWWQQVAEQLGVKDVDRALEYAITPKKKKDAPLDDLPLFGGKHETT